MAVPRMCERVGTPRTPSPSHILVTSIEQGGRPEPPAPLPIPPPPLPKYKYKYVLNTFFSFFIRRHLLILFLLNFFYFGKNCASVFTRRPSERSSVEFKTLPRFACRSRLPFAYFWLGSLSRTSERSSVEFKTLPRFACRSRLPFAYFWHGSLRSSSERFSVGYKTLPRFALCPL